MYFKIGVCIKHSKYRKVPDSHRRLREVLHRYKLLWTVLKSKNICQKRSEEGGGGSFRQREHKRQDSINIETLIHGIS